MKPTHIGGQAVIEGVMMRGKKMYSLAVRTPENSIYIENVDINSISSKFPILKLPIIRGIVAFIESMVLGMKIITKSAEIATEDDGEPQEVSKFEKFLEDKLGERLNDVIMGVSVVFSLVIGVLLFMLLPVFLSSLINKFIPLKSWLLLSFLEGVTRIIIFLSYLYIISLSKEIQKVFMYHGAEHKTISCFENGEELIVENVRKYTRLHKRCGTSFLLIVMIISIFVFMFLKTDVLWIRLLSRIIFVPFIAGISYEVIKFAGTNDSKIVSILSAPGLMLQNLTTREPNDQQIEVAIAAMNGVLQNEPN